MSRLLAPDWSWLTLQKAISRKGSSSKKCCCDTEIFKYFYLYNIFLFFFSSFTFSRIGGDSLVYRLFAPSALAVEFLRHSVLSGGTQRFTLLLHQSEEMKTLNISFFRVGIEPITSRIQRQTLVPLGHQWHHFHFFKIIFNIMICRLKENKISFFKFLWIYFLALLCIPHIARR